MPSKKRAAKAAAEAADTEHTEIALSRGATDVPTPSEKKQLTANVRAESAHDLASGGQRKKSKRIKAAADEQVAHTRTSAVLSSTKELVSWDRSLDAAAEFVKAYGASARVEVPEIVIVHQARQITEWLVAQAGKPTQKGSSNSKEPQGERHAARIWGLLGDLLCCKYTSPHLQLPAFLVQGIIRDCSEVCLKPTGGCSVQLALSLERVLHTLHTKFEQTWRPTLEQLSSALQAILQVVITLESSDPEATDWESAHTAWSCTATTAANMFCIACAMHPVPKKVYTAVAGRLLPCLLQCCCPPKQSHNIGCSKLRAACASVFQQAFLNMQEIAGLSSGLEQATASIFVQTKAAAPREPDTCAADKNTEDGPADDTEPVVAKSKLVTTGSYHKALLQGIVNLLSPATAAQELDATAAAALRSLPHVLEWFVLSWRRHTNSAQPESVKPARSKQVDGQRVAAEFNLTAWILDQLMQWMTKASGGEEGAGEPVEPKKKKRKTGRGEATPCERERDPSTRLKTWARLAEAAAKVITVAKELQAYQPSKDVSGACRFFLTRFARQVVQQSQLMWSHGEAAVAAANLTAALLDLEIRCISAETEVLWQLCWQAAAASPTHGASHSRPAGPSQRHTTNQPEGALHLARRLLIAALEIRQLQAALELLMQQMTKHMDPHAAMVLSHPWFVDTLLAGVKQVPPGQKAGLVSWVAEQMRMCSQLPDCPPELALPVVEICSCILYGIEPDLSTAPAVHEAACKVVAALTDPLSQLLGVCLALEAVVQPVLLQLWLRVFQGTVRLTSRCTGLLPSLEPLPGQSVKPAGNDSISAQALQPMTQHYFYALAPAENMYTSSSSLDSATLLTISQLILNHTSSLTSKHAPGDPAAHQEDESGERAEGRMKSNISSAVLGNSQGDEPYNLTEALQQYAGSSLVLCCVLSILQRLDVLRERHLRLSCICPLITLNQPAGSRPTAAPSDNPTPVQDVLTEDQHAQSQGKEEGDASNMYASGQQDKRRHAQSAHQNMHQQDDGDDAEQAKKGKDIDQHQLEGDNSIYFTDMHIGEGPSELDELLRQELLTDMERESGELVQRLLQLFCTLTTGQIALEPTSQLWPTGSWRVLLTHTPAWSGILSCTAPKQVVLGVWMMMGESMELWWPHCPDMYAPLWAQCWLDACTITPAAEDCGPETALKSAPGAEGNVKPGSVSGVPADNAPSGVNGHQLHQRHPRLALLQSFAPAQHQQAQLQHGSSFKHAISQLQGVVGNFTAWATITNFAQALVSSLSSAVSSALMQLLQLTAASSEPLNPSSCEAGVPPTPVTSKVVKKLLQKVQACAGDTPSPSPLTALATGILIDCPPSLLSTLLRWLKDNQHTFKKASKEFKPFSVVEVSPGQQAPHNGVAVTGDEHVLASGAVPLGDSTDVAVRLLHALQILRLPDVLSRLSLMHLQELVTNCFLCAAVALSVVSCWGHRASQQTFTACSAWEDCFQMALNGASDALQWIQSRSQGTEESALLNKFLTECQEVISSLSVGTQLLLAHCLASSGKNGSVAASRLVDSWTRLRQHAGCVHETEGQDSKTKNRKKVIKPNGVSDLYHLLHAATHPQTDTAVAGVSPHAFAAQWLSVAGLHARCLRQQMHGQTLSGVNTSDVVQAVRAILGATPQQRSLTTGHNPGVGIRLLCAHVAVWAVDLSQHTSTGGSLGESTSIQEVQYVLQALPRIGTLLSGENVDSHPGSGTQCSTRHVLPAIHLLSSLVSLAALPDNDRISCLLSLSASLLRPMPLALLSSAAAAKNSIAALIGAPVPFKPSFTAACSMALDAACIAHKDPVFSQSMMMCQAISAACATILSTTSSPQPAAGVANREKTAAAHSLGGAAKAQPETAAEDDERDLEEDVKDPVQGVLSLLINVLTSSVNWSHLHAALICCGTALDAPRGSPLQRSISSNSSRLCSALCTVLARCKDHGPGLLVPITAGDGLKGMQASTAQEAGALQGLSQGSAAGNVAQLEQVGDAPLQAGAAVVLCCALHCLEEMLGRPARFKLGGSMVVHVLGMLPAVLGEQQAKSHDGRRQTRWEHDVEGGSLAIVAVCQTLIALCRQHAEPLARGMASMVDVQGRLLAQLAAWAHNPDVLMKYSHLMDKCADAMCRVWEVLAEHKSSLGKYCLHFMPHYINLLVLGPSGSPPVSPRNQLLWQPGLAALAPASPAQALRRGAYSLMTCLNSHDLQYLHALGGQVHFGPTYREALADLKKDFDRNFKYEGKV